MDERELFWEAQGGEKAARDILFNKNTGLIYHVMKRFMSRGIEADDLFQLGSVGLLKAIDKFNPDYGVCFSTYAVPLIMGEIQRFLRDDGIIKISRTIKENFNKIKRIRENLIQGIGREPTLKEISDETGISIEDIVIALDSCKEVESIYKTIYETDGSEICLIDTLGSDGESDGILDKMLLESLLKRLNEQEKLLIKLRFFDNQTQMQVAGRLGMSQVQVSRMEKKILTQLRLAAVC